MEFLTGYSSTEETEEPVNVVYCGMCKVNKASYKCPRCSLVSCSLACCKNHKIAMNCSGQRDRTEYTSVNQFTESHLRNDYHFLEDVLQSKQRGIRTFGVDVDKTNTKKTTTKVNHTQSTKKLLRACESRSINLIILSHGMSKRTINTSYFQANTNTIFWRLHIIFINGSNYNISDLFQLNVTNDKNDNFRVKGCLVEVAYSTVKETVSIDSILNEVFELKSDNAIQRHALRDLRLASSDQLCCFLQKIPTSANHPTFYEVPLNFNLKDILSNKTMIEFPVLFIGKRQDTEKLNRAITSLITTDVMNNNESLGIKNNESSLLKHDNKRQKILDRNDIVVSTADIMPLVLEQTEEVEKI